jgi:hypothetical protein
MTDTEKVHIIKVLFFDFEFMGIWSAMGLSISEKFLNV